MNVTILQIAEIISTLEGTCMTLDQGVVQVMEVEDFELDIDALGHIDNYIFNCCTCGWWYEMSEEGGGEDEYICTNCIEDEEQ
jgi:hypothetical protein